MPFIGKDGCVRPLKADTSPAVEISGRPQIITAVGSFGSVSSFFAVDDLQEAALVGAVSEIDAIAFRPGRDRPVQFRSVPRRWSPAPGPGRPKSRIFLPDAAGSLEVVGPGSSAAYASRGRQTPGTQCRCPHFPTQFLWVSFSPPSRVDQKPDLAGSRDVPDFMRLAAIAGAAYRTALAVAFWGSAFAIAECRNHLARARRPRTWPSCPGIMPQIFRLRGIGDIDDGGAIWARPCPVRGLTGAGDVVGAAVMADIGDPAIALMMDGRLITRLRACQVAGSDQLHVGTLRVARRDQPGSARRHQPLAGDEGDTKEALPA